MSAAAVNKFNTALDTMAQHDKAGDWNDATCTSTAALFVEAAKEQGDKTFGEALYNAGLANQRCKKDAEAKAFFKQVLDKDPKFHRPGRSSRSTPSLTRARRTSTRPSPRCVRRRSPTPSSRTWRPW